MDTNIILVSPPQKLTTDTQRAQSEMISSKILCELCGEIIFLQQIQSIISIYNVL
jgi:hypothetical protein